MKLQNLRNLFTKQLASIFPKAEIDSFFFLLIEDYLHLQRVEYVLNRDLKLTKEEVDRFTTALKRLHQQEPIQYILVKTMFYGLSLYVDKNTLIPRPETEELVTWVLNQSSDKKKKINILDIGTGSGCIAIALKNELPKAVVYALDSSKEALETAKKNAELNKVAINFIHQDILKTSSLEKNFDIIISNPPYVRESEKMMMQKNVLNYEPKSALFVKDTNPLIFYKKIAELARNHLTSNGMLFFEINEYLGDETVQLISNTGFTCVSLKKDIFGKQRLIKANL